MKNTIISFFALLACLAIFAACTQKGPKPAYPFNDPSLTSEERVNDLLSRLTTEEKVSMMMNTSVAIERLGIPAYDWWNESLHGIARAGLATVFPQAIGLAATFDDELNYQTYSIASDEARAKYNDFIAQDVRRQYSGLTFWTPNINIFRDPRWGRGQETYGEDPYLTTRMGVAVVKGLQGDNPDFFKTHACAKHYAVHSGPEPLRHSFDVTVSPTDLWETYLPAFKSLVMEANVQEVMCAYNAFEGDPCCGSEKLLIDILRNKWGFEGLVVTDCGAVDDFYMEGHHEKYPDAVSASKAALMNGTDLECGSSFKSMIEGVKNGIITDADLDPHVARLIADRIELGLLDPIDNTPWKDMNVAENVSTAEHKAHNLKVTEESMVLLKNNNNVLPINKNIKKIAVVGSNANDSTMQMGNYNGTPAKTITILDGIKAKFSNSEVIYVEGAKPVDGYQISSRVRLTPDQENVLAKYWESHPEGDRSAILRDRSLMAKVYKEVLNIDIPMNLDPWKAPENFNDVVSQVKDADIIIYVGGLNANLEGEEMRGVKYEGFDGGDRTKIELPSLQSQLLKDLKNTCNPVVFVLCTGSTIALEQDEASYDALLVAWYPGEMGGTAVANVLSGDYNPAGRLPLTFYKSTSQLPDFLNYDMTGRTYRYFKGEPLYPFGYGISYTTFTYGNASLSDESIKAGESVTVEFDVTNSGIVDGEEVAQIYVRRLNDPNAPIKDLRAFKRMAIKAGSNQHFSFSLNESAFSYYNAGVDELAVKPGQYEILYGSSSADKDLQSLALTIN